MKNNDFVISVEEADNILYSDLGVPVIFVIEHMASMDSDVVKVYLYLLFLNKSGKSISIKEISKRYNISILKINEAINYLKETGLIDKEGKKIKLVDLKEKEIKRAYKPKSELLVNNLSLDQEKVKKREQVLRAISDDFFHGVMSPTWYTDILTWFDIYKFEEDVMQQLFQYCSDRRKLSKGYIMTVADAWHNEKIKDHFDLEKYYTRRQELQKIGAKIVKKLNLSRLLTEYEEEYVKKWVEDYNYGLDIIEIALQKTRSKTSPNFEYINAIIVNWHKSNLKTKEEIQAHIVSSKGRGVRKETGNSSESSSAKSGLSQMDNFKQTQFDDDDYEELFENIKRGTRRITTTG